VPEQPRLQPGGTDPPRRVTSTCPSASSTPTPSPPIVEIRGEAIGCVIRCPSHPGRDHRLIKVNVEVTLDGNPTSPSRPREPSDVRRQRVLGLQLDGDVEILGAGCAAIGSAADAQVDIVVGCDTIIN
jgi:hypothetical protein